MITDTQGYNTGMTKALIDKIYFMDKIESKHFIDFGCADASMIKFLALNFPELEFVGYDICEKMVKLAQENTKEIHNIVITSDPEYIKKYANTHDDICVILSSVIHEVYSYTRDVNEFWDFIWNEIKPQFVAIRDMCVSKTANRPSDSISCAKVRQTFDNVQLERWENTWGNIDSNWSLTHFFLTYRYEKNWDREAKENYLPINKEELLQLIPSEYTPCFIEHYTLPFLRREVKKTFNIELQENTHFKLIIERN